MTNDEIRALQDKCKWEMEVFDKISYDNTVALMSLVETMLAREAEVLAICDNFDMPVTDDIRATLNPQPAALAEENDKP